ncbi:MAG: MotA/TolQ/ExbB proton channel family protein [Verrucomicrobiota bacterium]
MTLFILILLVVASLVGLTFIVERSLALRWKKIVPPEVEESVTQCRKMDDLAMLRRVCEQKPSPLSRLLLLADKNRDWPHEENVDGLQTRARYEVARMERGLVILEIIVGIAPLLGLVGTIYGLITLFAGMGQTTLGDSNFVARGIADALNATLLGLLTAIPSLIAWSYFNKKVETLSVEMETICDDFLRRQYRPDKTHAAVISKK